MNPILYESTETEFLDNGLGRLRDCLRCIVTEERNGVYECEFDYPMDGELFAMITPGKVIGVTHDDTGDVQPFDIMGYTRPIDGVVTFHCVHISYRQSYLTVAGKNINSLLDAFSLLHSAKPSNPFVYVAAPNKQGFLAAADGIPKTAKQMLGGVEGSILDAYGGEYEFDKFTVRLHGSRGTDRDFSIRYGVNMLDYNETYDVSDSFSSCIPYWTDGTTTVIGSMQSAGQTVTGRGECVPLDVSEKFESKPSKSQVEAAGLAYMVANKTSAPARTINIEFVRLQDLGYENLSDLMRCGLCDTVNVIFPGYAPTRYKIVKTVWDALRGRYESMELGQLSPTLSEALGISSGVSSSSAGGPVISYDDETKTISSASERVSVPSGTAAHTVLSVTAPDNGYVLLSGYVQMAANSTGNRHIEAKIGDTVICQETQAAHGSQTCMMSISGIHPVNEGQSVSIAVWQNSGSALYAGGELDALFIAI